MTSEPTRTSENDASIDALVTLTAIGAEGLEGVASDEPLSFLYRRGEKFFLSEPSSAFPDGAVYWDAVSVQTCRLHDDKKKYIKLFVQKVPVGPDGLPTDFGTMVAAGYLDLGQFAQKRGEEHDMKVMLKPSGVLNVRIFLEDVVEGDGAHSTDVSSNSQCVTPEFQSEVSEESQVSEQIGVDAARDPQEVSSNHKATGKPERAVLDRARDATHSPSASNTMSSTSTLSYGDGLEEPGSHRSLESKLRRAQRQCEEARARAFSEASVALQRGIEIDNLKRAKDVLLRRLETAEQQLMTMMKQELAMTIQETDKSSATLLGMDTVIQQLASTKVALAEKEFEMMELNGKLKARDAHIQALLMHLDAIKESSLLTARSTSAEVGLKNDNREASDPVADGEEAREAGEPLDKPLDKPLDDPIHKHAQLSDEIKSPNSEEQEGGDRISDDDQPLKAANTLPTMTVRIHASTV